MHISELVLGHPYFSTRRLIKLSEYHSQEQHRVSQHYMVGRLLTLANLKIPFYRDGIGRLARIVSPENAFEVLQLYPHISKNEIRENLHRFRSDSSCRAVLAKTGGSSGNTLTFYMDRFITRQREKAFIWDLWSRVGYKPGDRVASFRGQAPGVGLFKHERLFSSYSFSPFQLSPKSIKDIVTALNSIKPLFLHGYPSTIHQLASLMRECKQTFTFQLKAVLCCSERIFEQQRSFLERIFNCRVYSWYGHSEYAVLGGECEVSHSYHLYPQYGVVEFLPTNITSESGRILHEIVATGFNNPVMPFIRYRTGDYAIIGESPCSCGRQYVMVEEIVGREQEFIVDNERNLISVTALTSLFEKLPYISDFAFVQNSPGAIALIIVPSTEVSKKMLDTLGFRISRSTEYKLKVAVETVSEIPRTSSGKRRYVAQGLDMKDFIR